MTIKFNELEINQQIQRAIDDMGFTETTPIQAQSIPFLLKGRDLVGQAQTGTGKTVAFGIPMIQSIHPDDEQGHMVICPTRELAIQLSAELRKLTKYTPGIAILPVFGGESINNQIRSLRRGVQIIVGTPGRILDHINRGTIKLGGVRMVVLDEADEMLNMGFRQDIEKILGYMPASKQTLLFSATMSNPILQIAKRHLKDPEFVKVASDKLTAPDIEQVYYETEAIAKVPTTAHLIKTNNFDLTIVFCNTKHRVVSVVKKLNRLGIRAEGLQGNMTQAARSKVFASFRNNELKVLVATDVAARGIDVKNVDAVINYDVPLDIEYYVHRIGRTGRAGQSGIAYSFVSDPDDLQRLRSIENYAKVKVARLPMPPEIIAETAYLPQYEERSERKSFRSNNGRSGNSGGYSRNGSSRGGNSSRPARSGNSFETKPKDESRQNGNGTTAAAGTGEAPKKKFFNKKRRFSNKPSADRQAR